MGSSKEDKGNSGSEKAYNVKKSDKGTLKEDKVKSGKGSSKEDNGNSCKTKNGNNGKKTG